MKPKLFKIYRNESEVLDQQSDLIGITSIPGEEYPEDESENIYAVVILGSETMVHSL